jgi:hypothetical protein
LYETDFVLWAARQAELLRRMAAGERVDNKLDWANLAKEIESLGRRDRRELHHRIQTVLKHLLHRRIQTVLEHLMLLDALPAGAPRYSSQRVLIEQHGAIDMLLEDNPSLRHEVASIIAKALPTARELARLSLKAHGKSPRVLLDQLNYTEDQVLKRWLP